MHLNLSPWGSLFPKPGNMANEQAAGMMEITNPCHLRVNIFPSSPAQCCTKAHQPESRNNEGSIEDLCGVLNIYIYISLELQGRKCC